MNQQVSFFNLSLRKLLLTEPDSFNKARIKIVFTVLIFSIVKIFFVIPIVYQHGQISHLERVLTMLLIYIILIKFLLNDKRYTLIIAHIMAWMGLMLVWSILFVFAQSINIILLQFVFMLILSSFYLLNRSFGIFYSVMGIMPVIIYMIIGNRLQLNIRPDEIASPAYEILVVLNFITIVIIHYLFHQAINNNIKEKEDLNKQLQIAVKEANLAVQSKSDFLSTMSHELRTPLISVIGMSELLLDQANNPEQEENLKILNFSAVSLHSLINDILDYNKLGSDKLKLETLSVNLYVLMNEICAGMHLQTKEKGLDLILNVDETIKDELIITDPTRISQIIYNLVGNAIKFTSKGSVSVSLSSISIDEESIHIRFSVIDTGIGISSDEKELIFEPFTQASTSTTRNFGGTGLGLAIVMRLLVLFNSDINLESTPGEGSNFFFDILFKRNKNARDEHPSDAESVYDISDLKVLIAEDNTMNRVLLKKIFSKWNNEPEFAWNGHEVTEKVSAQVYDIILMDIHMPLMDGYEATRIIRKMSDPSRSGIPIIALTASVSNNLYDKIKEAGMDDFIYKPFNSKELYSKLKQIALQV